MLSHAKFAVVCLGITLSFAWSSAAAQDKGAKPTTLKIELVVDAKVKHTQSGLALPFKIINNSPHDITTKMAHEWHGGLWPSTDLAASVTPRDATMKKSLHSAFLFGETGKATEKTVIPAGKSATFEFRTDWPGTGSVPARPFMDGARSGDYRVQLRLYFESQEVRQFVTSAEQAVELPPS